MGSGTDRRFNYFASMDAGASPVKALVVLHGYPRDANITFEAARRVVNNADQQDSVLVIAPVFQVGRDLSDKCSTPGVPLARSGDLLWTCNSWLQGDGALNGSHPGSFAVMDQVIAEVRRKWPGVRSITVAGFSAGGQMVQHYIGFAHNANDKVSVRYVVADPGTWLYFDPARVQPMQDGKQVDWSECLGGSTGLGDCSLSLTSTTRECPASNRWKYGTEDLPLALGRTAPEARENYASADIVYLEGGLDSGTSSAAAYKIMDKSCAANAQGPYRQQRGLAFLYYDNTLLAPSAKRVLRVVPGCAHDVACVFASQAAQESFLGSHGR